MHPTLPSDRLMALYEAMRAAYGPQHWWPAESPFEVMVGAVLTQNTAWGNVEKAISNLKAASLLEPTALAEAAPDRVAEAIRPAGYFNVKTRRLQAFCRYLVGEGGETALAARETARLRHDLLAVHGVGPETADDMLLYAFQRPVFVIDTYTRRLLARHGLIQGEEGYEALRHGFEAALPPDVALFNEYHALIVRHAKEACRKRPLCDRCCLRSRCPRIVA